MFLSCHDPRCESWFCHRAVHSHCGQGGRQAIINCSKLNKDLDRCNSSSGQTVKIEEVIIHPHWDPKRTDNDFSLVVLREPFPSIQVVRVNSDNKFPRDDQDVTVMVSYFLDI